MQLVYGTASNLQVVPVAASISGAPATSGPFTFDFPAGVNILDAQVQSIVAATTGAVYHAEIIATPAWTAAGGGVWVGTQAQCQASPPVGGFLPVGTYDIQNDQGLWMVGDGINSMRVTVINERWS